MMHGQANILNTYVNSYNSVGTFFQTRLKEDIVGSDQNLNKLAVILRPAFINKAMLLHIYQKFHKPCITL